MNQRQVRINSEVLNLVRLHAQKKNVAQRQIVEEAIVEKLENENKQVVQG